MITETTKQVIPFEAGQAKRVGEGSFFLDQIVWLNGAQIEIGDRVGFNTGCYVNGYGGLVIGDDTIIGPGTFIHTANHEMGDLDRPISGQGWKAAPVHIGERCWIGMRVCILPGVRIGDGCVIGAGSVVVADLEDFAIAVGNPARVVRSRR
jgi:acetyltransferase-like isoleucine patch superfamily enzyme